MLQNFFTVGMAGHIDHGKTTLTKALTGVETDRLKEEQAREISIEPGFAPLVQTETAQISIIDVPGHERFIRQMIAGVAGIDVVVLVIAADEGVMPQTREHLHILSYLGIARGVIAVTKADTVEADFLQIVKEDIKETVADTFLENAPLHVVDSVSNRGIDQFKDALVTFVTESKKRKSFSSFRLPIDHVFTVKGQGVVVRGTIFDGQVRLGDELTILPQEERVRVRQIQSHHEQKEVVYAGQRAALNIGGIHHEAIKRGDVLVKDDFYTPTSRIDIAFTPLASIDHPIRQRQLIKLYVGTSEVTGKLIFYDRNEVTAGKTEEILCQIELDEPVVVAREDRFILRRATPIETLGGGWILDPNGTHRRFGDASIEALRQIKEGSAEERTFSLLQDRFALTKEEILRLASVTDEEFMQIEAKLMTIGKQMYTKEAVLTQVTKEMQNVLRTFHESYPLRAGMDKAAFISQLRHTYPEALLTFILEKESEATGMTTKEDLVASSTFTPSFPTGWEARIKEMLATWEKDGAEVDQMTDYFTDHQIDPSLHQDLYYFLLHTNRAFEFDEDRLIAQSVVNKLKDQLYKATKGDNFTLQVAREIVGLSRKNLVPLLELFDRLHYTERVENERSWLI